MALFEINESCTRCGACIAACPIRLITLNDGLPSPVEDAEDLCINCGHCVAICPPAALRHRSMDPTECPPLRRDWHLPAEQAEHFLRSRRSIRSYRKVPVERKLLAKLLEVASCAPSGHNSQTVKWKVVHSAVEVRKLTAMVIDWMSDTIKNNPELAKRMNFERVVIAWEKGIDRVWRSAPHIVLTYAADNDRFAVNSCPTAIAYLELAAPSFGLGTCWGGYFTVAAKNWPPLQEALALPEGHSCTGAVMIGYPLYRYHRLPLRNKPQISWHD